MFEHVQAYAGDPILGLNEDYKVDPRIAKANLGIGIYFDEQGQTPLMNAVRKAEASVLRQQEPRSYLPIGGAADYREAVQDLVFGANREALREKRIVTVQTLAGSGALRIGADFLHRYFPKSEIWVSDPTWENHRLIFEASGISVNDYPYYDAETGGLLFEEMVAALRALPPRSIVLLHACCHNPTGVDLTAAQWEVLGPVFVEQGLIAFVDMAYQGLGEGIDEDAFGLRSLADSGVTCLVANSFSKTFSLYGERCGALSVVCRSTDEARRVLGQLTCTVRASYSTPPTHGARIIHRILREGTLRAEWEQELESMRERILAMRRSIYIGLSALVDSP